MVKGRFAVTISLFLFFRRMAFIVGGSQGMISAAFFVLILLRFGHAIEYVRIFVWVLILSL